MRRILTPTLTALPLVLVLASSSQPYGQAPAPTPSVRFDVASIRQNVSGETRAELRIEPGGRLTATNYTLFDLVRNAWGVQPFQIVRGERVPDWFERDRWDVIAKAPAEAAGQEERLVSLLQNLLADRFKMRVAREQRELPVYALVLVRTDGRLGPQLRPSSGECEAARVAREKRVPAIEIPPVSRGFCGTRAGAGSVSTSGVPLAHLARNLAPQTGRFVIDRTGLTGPYDLDLKWTPDQTAGGVGQGQGAQVDGTSLFAAMQEQLGLRLDAQRAPVEVVVVDSAERPTDN